MDNKPNFTWSDKEDDEIYNHGIRVAFFQGRSAQAQKLVEALSYATGHKVDFSISAGIIHVDVLRDGVDAVVEKINDEEFMKEFIVKYSPETYENGTYLERVSIA